MDIKNLIFKIKYDTKYKIDKLFYPEIDKIMNDSKYSLPYINCVTVKELIEMTTNYYLKNCIDIENRYQEILNNLVILINDLIDNPNIFEIMYIYGYLYYNGYLSVDNSFDFIAPDKEIFFKKSISLFTGKSVCRNIGSFFSDLLDKYNRTNYGIITDRYSFESKVIDLYPKYLELLNLTDTDYSDISTSSNTEGNHFEVLVLTKNNSIQLLDPSNLAAYKLNNIKNNYASVKYLRYWSLYASGNYNLNECINIYNLTKNTYLHLYNSDKFISMQEKCYDTCEKNKQKILSFYNKNCNNIKFISDSIPKKD